MFLVGRDRLTRRQSPKGSLPMFSTAAGQRPRVGPTKAAVGRSGKISRKTVSSSQPEAVTQSRSRWEAEIDRAWEPTASRIYSSPGYAGRSDLLPT